MDEYYNISQLKKTKDIVYDENDKKKVVKYDKNYQILDINLEDSSSFLPIYEISILIHLWFSYMLEQNDYTVKSVDDLKNTLDECLEIANIMGFTIISRKESKPMRLKYSHIISKSFPEQNIYDRDHDDEIDNDLNDDTTSISSVLASESYLEHRISNILNKNYNFDQINIFDFLNELKTNNKTSRTRYNVKIYDFLVDSSFSERKKKIIILRDIFRNNDSDNSKLSELILHIESLDCEYAEKRLTSLKSIPKSIWHLYHSMDLSFLIIMLIWVENSINRNPHEIFVLSLPLLRLLLEYISLNEPEMEYINDIITPDVDITGNKELLKRNRNHMKKNLEMLIDIIERSKDVKDCPACKEKISNIINNQDQHLATSTNECMITKDLKRIRQSIHNLNKHTKKKFNESESQKATAVSPVLKQILSLIGTISNMNKISNLSPDKRLVAASSSDTSKKRNLLKTDLNVIGRKKLINLETFENYQNEDYVSQLTLCPLTINDLLQNKKQGSYIIEFKNNNSKVIYLSLHICFLSNINKYIYVLVDNLKKDDQITGSIGKMVISKNVKYIHTYLSKSFYSNKKLNVKMIMLKTEEMDTDLYNDYLDFINSI